MKQKIRVLAVKSGEGVARFLDEWLTVQEVRFEKGAEPEFETVKHATVEVVAFNPFAQPPVLELKHRKS